MNRFKQKKYRVYNLKYENLKVGITDLIDKKKGIQMDALR